MKIKGSYFYDVYENIKKTNGDITINVQDNSVEFIGLDNTYCWKMVIPAYITRYEQGQSVTVHSFKFKCKKTELVDLDLNTLRLQSNENNGVILESCEISTYKKEITNEFLNAKNYKYVIRVNAELLKKAVLGYSDWDNIDIYVNKEYTLLLANDYKQACICGIKLKEDMI